MQVHIVIGEPIPVADLVTAAAQGGWPEAQLYAAVAGRVERRLNSMHSALVHQVGPSGSFLTIVYIYIGFSCQFLARWLGCSQASQGPRCRSDRCTPLV